MTTPDGAQLVVGDVEWLDGLGVHLPGPATSPPAACIEVSSYDVSEAVNSGIPQKLASHGNRTEVSENCINTRLQCHDENASDSQNFMPCPERKEKSKDSCNQAYGNGETEVDQMCIDAPCCVDSDKQTTFSATMQCECASDQCECSVMDSSSRLLTSQQQEQSSFLVLAAGVLNEPGRLFTLWWAQSRHTYKCKKE